MIKVNGQPKTQWCMAYERANASLKLPQKFSKNFIDPSLTMATGKQLNSLNIYLEKRYLTNNIVVEKFENIIGMNLKYVENLPTEWASSESEIAITNKVEINGTTYTSGLYIVIDVTNAGYTFGRIEFIIVENLEPLFVLSIFETIEFDENRLLHFISVVPGCVDVMWFTR